MIDLRSDTVTLPTEEMREAMRAAPLGDDSREGDPTVRRLEQTAATITGKEAALFVASGTMSNLVALLAHTGRGGEVLLDGDCHIMRSEMGGIASLAGLFYRPIPSRRGAPDLDEVGERLSEKLSGFRLATALVCVETTHNSAGGAVLPLDYMARLRALTAEKDVPVHIDGARIFNAAVALGVPAAEIARHGDSIGFCVSKGLSAPFGSVLCGSADFIEKARAYRRMVGGGMRQAGVMAAAGWSRWSA
jgi:threonine aldolase